MTSLECLVRLRAANCWKVTETNCTALMGTSIHGNWNLAKMCHTAAAAVLQSLPRCTLFHISESTSTVLVDCAQLLSLGGLQRKRSCPELFVYSSAHYTQEKSPWTCRAGTSNS